MIQDFGNYQIIEKIGTGGMATVYTAVQKSLNRTVVLKIMHEFLQDDPTFVARFEREAKAAATLCHENIVQIIDYGESDGTWYIAMEHIGGDDLKKWLERVGPPPIEIAAHLLYDLCDGLDHAHQHHIVHRDIKPANIMLAPSGAPKIADFGLAKRTQESTVLTVHETMIGTVPYMSPEHATGGHVDERSDIFSLGVVAYELLGGRRPFPGDSSASVINAIVTLEPDSPSEVNPLVTDELERVVLKMLQKDPAKRYPSAQAVRRDLEPVIDELGIARGRDLLGEYLREPEAVAGRLHEKQLKDHINRAYQYKGMGQVKIDDAIREFERVLFLDPENRKVEKDLTELLARKPKSARKKVPKGRARSVPRARRGGIGRWAIAGAAAAVIALSLLVWRPWESPKPVEWTARPAPEAGEEKNEPEGVTPARFARATPPPTQQVDSLPGQENSREADHEMREPVEKPPAPTHAREEKRPSPPVQNGTMEIAARPSATFLVNGERIAEDVSVVSLSFAPGEYDVRVENPFYKPREWRGVRVVSNETVRLSHDFRDVSEGCFLTVTTNRIPAVIWIDGASTGKWTPQRDLPITPGLHTVTVAKEGFTAAEGEVRVTCLDGETTELSFTLEEN